MRARQEPTYKANIPQTLKGDGEKAAKLAAAWFGEPMPWQRTLLDAMLARDGDGYALMELGISVPRQNGKSWVVRARCFFGALKGEKILYTCHHGDTADEMFLALSAPFDDPDEPELRSYLKHVRKANGKQSIELANGGRIRFITRTDAGSRGTGFDALIIDEAQELTDAQQAALLPITSASAKGNPQTVYLGTPPDPKRPATVFRNLHDVVHSGKSEMPWMEWAAEEVGDPSDAARWYETNPSLGRVLLLKSVKGEAHQMKPETFARERLGWWSPSTGGAELALDAAKWEAATVKGEPEAGKYAWGVKFSPDGHTVACAWCKAERGQGAYVELHDVAYADAGTAGISELLLRNADRIAAVCIDGKAGADALIRRLADGGFPKKAVMAGSTATVQAAAAMLADELNAGTLAHPESPALDESAETSVKRSIGNNGGWGFGDGEGMSAPIEAASLALYAARTTKRDPRQVQEANF